MSLKSLLSLEKITSRIGIRARLTLMSVLIFGTTIIVSSLYAYYSLSRSLTKDFDDALYNYCIDFSETIEIEKDNTLRLPPLKVNESKVFPFVTGETLFAIRYITGDVLAVSSQAPEFNPPYQLHVDFILKGHDSSYETLRKKPYPNAPNEPYRLITFPLDDDRDPKLFLQIAAPMTTLQDQLDHLKKNMLIGIPAILIIAIFTGLYISARALRPVTDMINETNQISAADLNRRVNIPKTQDEIRKLGETLNLMFERIEKAFTTQERFVADASHQLLTPLTILRGEIELKAKSVIEPKEKPFYQSLLQEIDALTGIIKGMLLLAQIDSGKNILQLTDVYVADVLLETISTLQKIASRKSIQIHFNIKDSSGQNEVRIPIAADEELIRQLFFNLIENAIKYSAQNTEIFVRVHWTDLYTEVEIEDFGKGIPPELKETVFARFSRADSSSHIKGFGLGLPIAQKIAELHGAKISLKEKSSPGSIFMVSFQHPKTKT